MNREYREYRRYSYTDTMEQNNCPSSNNWVKFDDCDQVTELNCKHNLTPLVLTPQVVHKSGQRGDVKKLNYSRYSAFDQLRVEMSGQGDLGWSRYLLGTHQDKEEPGNWKKRG